jgi:hypothetical protein
MAELAGGGALGGVGLHSGDEVGGERVPCRERRGSVQTAGGGAAGVDAAQLRA